MPFALYDATVANYLQTLSGVTGFLEMARAHFADAGVDVEKLLDERLAPDMLPLRIQIAALVHHARGAIAAAKSGDFYPPKPSDANFAALQALVTMAHDELAAMPRDSIDALAGRDVTFHLGDRKLPFTTENFLMSFSLPNFYFHATTAYDILRHKGAPLGKRDFLGALRMKKL